MKKTEQIDDLQLKNLKIIQKTSGFKFGTDAVLLSDFAKDITSEKILDLCTGTGIIPLLLYGKKEKIEKIYGIEIQTEIADMAKRSCELNNLEDKIEIINDDLKNAVNIFGKRSFDLITCNPPYLRENSAVLNENDSKTISRHEVMCTLEDIISISSKLLTQKGKICLVYRPSRLCELIFLMKKYSIEPKVLRFVQKNADSAPELVLVMGLYDGKSDVKILPPLILYNKDNSPTDELKRIYSL